jgi:hypothetical protein
MSGLFAASRVLIVTKSQQIHDLVRKASEILCAASGLTAARGPCVGTRPSSWHVASARGVPCGL